MPLQRCMQVMLNGMLCLLQGLVSAMLWQALQLLDHSDAALHASQAEWHVAFAAGVGVSYVVAGTAAVGPALCGATCKSC